MNKFVLLIVFISLCSCGIDRTIINASDHELKTLEYFQQLQNNHTLTITDENEPGTPLLLCLTFVNKFDKAPLKNQLIQLYHTSTDGNYNPVNPNDESTARLSGQVVTNAKGQVFVTTILPGDYGSSTDNRHIHITVFNAKPEAYDINFKQYTGTMGLNFINGSDQHFLADLKKVRANKLVTFLTIEVKKPNNPLKE